MLDFLGGIIAYPFRWIDSISPNYVVTLILFAVVMKIVLFPFGIKQQKNSVKQAKLRPYETIIRKKYAGRTDNVSKQKMNEEIMALYQQENFNPASGCLPMLLQLPILFALYQVIIKPATFLLQFSKPVLESISSIYTELAQIEALKWSSVAQEIVQIDKLLSVDRTLLSEELVTKLNGVLNTTTEAGTTVQAALEGLRESFTVFGINLMETPSFGLNLLMIIPVLVFVSSYFSMKLTRKFTYQPQMTQDNATKSSMALMDISMPLISTWICFSVPAGIGVYWVLQSVLGVVQQFLLYKMFPIPPITEEELKEAEQKMKGKQKKAPREKAIEVTATEPKAAKVKKNAAAKKAVSISDHAVARIKASGKLPAAKRRI